MTTAYALPLGLILDWGGVLTTSVNESFATFIETEGVDPEVFKATMRHLHDDAGSALHLVETGDLPREQFEQQLASSLRTLDGRPVSPDALLERMFGQLQPNEPVRAIVRAARERGWRTVVLSNAWGMDYDESDLLGLAGTLLLSNEIGLRKPDPAAFLYAAHMLALTPEACVVVDDMRRNALAASAIGMVGFQYRAGTEGDLESVLRAYEARLAVADED